MLYRAEHGACGRVFVHGRRGRRVEGSWTALSRLLCRLWIPQHQTPQYVHISRTRSDIAQLCGATETNPTRFTPPTSFTDNLFLWSLFRCLITDYISHSLPREVTRWIFAAALPNITGKVLVDVGSRLGPVLWMGYLFSHAKKLIGIELNKTFANLAQQIVDTNKFGERISIVNDNALNQGDILKDADVVVLNNVFEWFSDQQELRNLWEFVSKAISKKGAIVVTCPSIEESLEHAGVRI